MKHIIWDQNAVEGEFTFAHQVHADLFRLYREVSETNGVSRVVISPTFYTLLISANGEYLVERFASNSPSESSVYNLGQDTFGNFVLLNGASLRSEAVFMSDDGVTVITTTNESFV